MLQCNRRALPAAKIEEDDVADRLHVPHVARLITRISHLTFITIKSATKGRSSSASKSNITLPISVVVVVPNLVDGLQRRATLTLVPLTIPAVFNFSFLFSCFCFNSTVALIHLAGSERDLCSVILKICRHGLTYILPR